MSLYDISARGLWNTIDNAFFDVRVSQSGAESNKAITMDTSFEKLNYNCILPLTLDLIEP